MAKATRHVVARNRLLSRREQWLYALMLSIFSFVCLFVGLSVRLSLKYVHKNAIIFSKTKHI